MYEEALVTSNESDQLPWPKVTEDFVITSP